MNAINYNRMPGPGDLGSPPDDDELDHFIEQVEDDDERMADCREAAFDTEDPIALGRLLAECKDMIAQLANGRRATELDHPDQFAKLAREVDRLAANLADKVRDKAEGLLQSAQDDAAEMRAEQIMASREDAEEWR